MKRILNKESRAAIELMIANDLITKDVAEKYFPELKESEDERIRKCIEDLIKENTFSNIYGVTKKECLAYLEKQGKQKPVEPQQDMLSQEKYAKAVDECIYGEQKPADEVEHKFNVGDFLVSDYCMGKVVELTNDAYLLDTEQGIPFSCEHNAHIWTIQDTKDGDVLNSTRVQATIIFKGFAEDGKHINAYCALQSGIFIHQEMLWDRDFEPASKNWKNALFDAIKESGYEWDAEKKELKKIEQKLEEKPFISLKDFQEAFELKAKQYDINLPNRGYDIHAMCKELYSLLIKQEPAWSEEDNQIALSIEQVMNCASLLNIAPEKMDKIRTWLKSLKDRYTWKPSDEQMDALYTYIYNPQYFNSQDPRMELVESVYQDLKKLREE